MQKIQKIAKSENEICQKKVKFCKLHIPPLPDVSSNQTSAYRPPGGGALWPEEPVSHFWVLKNQPVTTPPPPGVSRGPVKTHNPLKKGQIFRPGAFGAGPLCHFFRTPPRGGGSGSPKQVSHSRKNQSPPGGPLRYSMTRTLQIE